jgi:hypothetical protein
MLDAGGGRMMNGKVVVGALLSILFSVATVEARGPYGSINVGNWKGGAYTNDQTGAFSHCVAGASYDSGIYFMVLIDQGATWSLGFQHPKWSFTNNQQFPIALTFDGQSPFHVQGVAIGENLVRVPMPTDSALIGQFRKAKTMTAFTQGQLFQFKLDQTAVLLPTLANCVAVVKQQGIAKAGDFSVKSAAKPAAVAATPPAGGSPKPSAPQNVSPEMQIEAIELASNFILKTTLHNPRVLSRAETTDRRRLARRRMEIRRGCRFRQDRPAHGPHQRSRCYCRRGGDRRAGLQRQICFRPHQRIGRQRCRVPRILIL